MRWLFVLVVLTGCGDGVVTCLDTGDVGVPCYGHLTATLLVEDEFDAEQREVIRQAAEEWRAATSGTVDITLELGERREEWSVTVDPEEPYLGRTWTLAHRIELYSGLRGDGLRRIALHEFGHFFGLDHDVEGTIMSTSSRGMASEVTERDVRQFEELYAR